MNLVLGTDCVAADSFSNDAKTQICPVNNIPDGWMGLDAGPDSILAFRNVILPAKTILWNGRPESLSSTISQKARAQ